MTAVLLLFSAFNMVLSGELMEDSNLELISHKERCDLVLVSQPGVNKGNVLLVAVLLFNTEFKI